MASLTAMLASLNREGKTVASRTLFLRQALMIASHRLSVISSGFSTITCLPALAAATAGSMWAPLGVQIVTMWTFGSATISFTVPYALHLLAAAKRSAEAGMLSVQATILAPRICSTALA